MWQKSLWWTLCRIIWTTKYINLYIIMFLLLQIVDSNTILINRSSLKNSGTKILSSGIAVDKESVESSLQTIHDIATENLGTLCISKSFRPLQIALITKRYDSSRQKADLAASVLQELGVNRHGGLLDALTRGLLYDDYVMGARILATNITNGILATSVWWSKNKSGISEPFRLDEDGVKIGTKPDLNYPWFEEEIPLSPPSSLHSPKFAPNPDNVSNKGKWTYPYYSCNHRRWILSYSIIIPANGRHGVRGFLSIDIDVSELQVNQCSAQSFLYLNQSIRNDNNNNNNNNKLLYYENINNQIEAFYHSHKCHHDSMKCEYSPLLNGGNKIPSITNNMWTRGAYRCLCKQGYYSLRHPKGFNGTIMEVAYEEYRDNISTFYEDVFRCIRCSAGCLQCVDASPCLATYNWAFRMSLLTISLLCVIFTLSLICYMHHHRKVKVFKVASPIFLTLTLIGCATMYGEMAAIFPILDLYSCIATKWTRHMGFCLTYTALLMKTWRVSLTYRVKSAHKVKLTDKQLLQWMVPILLVMIIYLSTWTISATPTAEVISDQQGLKFKQCSYNWWDHSLAIGEVLFLAWGIKICYNVRNAESLYNEARMISYAIYNIALVNTTMISIHLFIFPQAGPDIKYLLGFIRTQLSTSVTIGLVFGPKIVRVLKGQGDQWDNRARVRGITASFSLNGIGLVPEESPDLYQENDELKEQVQKLAAQIEFMKIVHMEINNRHVKPKPGSYFTIVSSLHSPLYKGLSTHTQTSKHSTQQNSGISDDGHSGSNSIGTNSIGYPTHNPVPSNNSNTEKV